MKVAKVRMVGYIKPDSTIVPQSQSLSLQYGGRHPFEYSISLADEPNCFSVRCDLLDVHEYVTIFYLSFEEINNLEELKQCICDRMSSVSVG